MPSAASSHAQGEITVSKLFVTFAALAWLAFHPAAQADEPSQQPDAAGLFTQLDENQDGQLARDEIPDDRKSLFDRLLRIGDKNGDGKLGAEEFAAALAGGRPEDDEPQAPARPQRPADDERPGPGRFFARLDANGDGKIELDEIPEQGRERFEKLIARADKDGDGALSLKEFAKAAPGGEPAKPGKPNKPGKPGKGKKPQAARDPSRLFERLDRNADGKVTVDEVPEERREMLERMIERGDKDGDGAISLEEFKATVERRKPGDAKPKKPQTPARTAGFGPMRPGLFLALDADGDGQLSGSEIEAAPAVLRKLDADGDGALSPHEVMAPGVPKKK
jgi:Ca2+-binding EF-hand superfamily protein